MVLVSWLSALRRVLRRPASNRIPWKPELALAGSSIERFRPPVKLAPEIESFEERTLLSVTTFTVNTTTDTVDANPGDGLALDSAGNTSLRAAIQEANAASGGVFEILVPTGTYNLTLTGANEDTAGTGDLDILPGAELLTIRSLGIGEESEPVIRGLFEDRIFDIHANATLILEDIIIRDGSVTDDAGGAIRNSGVLNMIRGQITDSSAQLSGGGPPALGGAISNTGFLSVSAVEFAFNESTGHGGAIHNAGTASLDQAIFFHNSAVNTGPADGGAVFNAPAGTLVLARSELTQNTGQRGGAIFNAGNASVSNSTIGMNQADDGGGIFNDGAQAVLNLTHVTIAENAASNEGGGLFHTANAAAANVSSSIIALNTAATPGLIDVAGRPTSFGANVIGIGGLPTGFVDGVNSDRAGSTSTPLDPLLSLLDSHGGFTQTYALQVGSPAINNASGFPSQTGTFESDQRGAPRLIDGFRDSGAFESGFAGVFVNTTLDTNDADPGDGIVADSMGRVSLRAAIEEANFSFTSVAREVVLSPGVYRLTILGEDDNGTSGDLDIAGTHSLLGTSSQSVTIDAGGNDRVIDFFTSSPGGMLSNILTGVTLQNGATDESGGALRSFTNLVLSDVRIQDSSAELDGGGIANRGNMTLSNVQLLRNTAVQRGGAIATDGQQLIIANSFLNGNSVTGDPDTFIPAAGGAVALSGSVTIQNSTLQGNSTTGRGGAIAVDTFGTLSLLDSILTGNSADRSGGALVSEGNTQIIRSLLQNNSADLSGGGVAVSAGTLNVIGTGITGNVAGEDGGGLNIRDAEQVTIQFSFIENNQARHGGGLNFGATTATIQNSTVADNSAAMNGGGLQLNSGLLEIRNSTISTNTTGEAGGGIINEGGHLTLLNATVTANTGGMDGGGLFNTAQGRTFSGNTIIAGNQTGFAAASDVAGRVITSLGSNLIGADSTGSFHGANSDLGDLVGTSSDPVDPMLGPLTSNGGSTRTHLLLAGSPAIDSGNNTLPVGQVEQRGSRRSIGLEAPTIDIGATEFNERITFFVNTVQDTFDFNPGDGVAEDSFGATSLRAAIQEANALNQPVEIVLPAGIYQLSQFGPGDNEALFGDLDITSNQGITIYGSGRTATIIDGLMGDRIFDVIESTLRLESLTLRNGAVFGENGGLIRAASSTDTLTGTDGPSTLELHDVDLINGRATEGNGGAIFISSNSTSSSFLMSGGTIRNSRAESVSFSTGGAIHAENADATLLEVIISGNQASAGGGLYFGQGTLTIQNSLFSENVAEFDGGGALLSGFSGLNSNSISGTRFLENRAGNGAGLYNTSNLDLLNSEIALNEALFSGGGIYNDGEIDITGSSITGNSSFDSAGGIDNQSFLTLVDSEVSGNFASQNGGGIYSIGSATLVRSTIANNAASTGGGIYSDSILAIMDSTLSENSASVSGGGLYVSEAASGTSVVSSTIVNNVSFSSGGGISNDSSQPVDLWNTLVALNGSSATFDPDLTGTFTSSGHNLIGDPRSAAGFTNGVMGDIVGGTLIGPVTDIATDSPIVVTVTGHGLQTGDRVRIENTGVSTADGSFQVTVLDENRFELDGTGGGETYTGGGEVFRLINPRIGALTNNTTVSGTSSSPAHPGTSGPVVTRTHALLPGSPAIDAGDNAAISPEETDQRGFFRPVDGNADSSAIADIGAFELLHTSVTGRIFSDLDGNGIQGPGEPGLFLRTVYADLNGNGRFDESLEPSTQTLFDIFETPEDETGLFVLDFVPPGDITISVVIPDGERITTTPSIRLSDPAIAVSRSNAPELDQPFDVASVDLNGDRLPDLVMTSSSSGLVIVQLTGATPLTTITRSYFAGNGPENLETADLNGDGFRDLVLTAKGDDRIAVLMNRGDGTFADAVFVATGDEPRDFLLADLTGDGHLDIAVANGISNDVTILEGDGTGSFINLETIPVGQSPRAIELMVSSNIDGWRLVTADKDSDQLSFIRRTENGFEVSEVLSLGDGTLPSTLLATDLDYDGVTDLLIGQEGTGTVEVVYGRAGSPLQSAQTFASPGLVTDLAAADLDGDLDLDVLILGGSSNGSVTVVTNLSTGNPGDRLFSAATLVDIGSNPSRLRIVNDPAGDGRPDVLVASLNSQEILRLTNLSGSTLASVETGLVADAGAFGIQETGAVYGLIIDDLNQSRFLDSGEVALPDIEVYLDLNRNGIRDLFEPVAVTEQDDPATTFTNEAGQYFFLNLPINRQYQVGVSLPVNRTLIAQQDPHFIRRPVGLVTGQLIGQAAVDLDGDGHLDALVLTSNGVESFFRVFMGDGAGSLAGGPTLAAGDAADHFTLLDVDGDEDSDVAVLRSSGTLDIYLNDAGTLAFDRQITVPAGMTRIRSADMNGDGRTDLILSTDSAGPSDNAFQVLINDPDTSDLIALPGDITTLGISVADFAVADVNGDGTLDIAAVGASLDNSLYVFLNDGNGELSLLHAGFLAGNDAASLALADFDGDGALDAAVITLESQFLEVHYGIALGSTSFARVIQSVFVESGGLLVEDLNGDGRPDIAVDSGVNGTSILINVGESGFTTHFVDSIEAVSMVSGDFDGDGRADLIAASDGDGVLLRLLLNRPDQRSVDVNFGGIFSSVPADFATTQFAQISGIVFEDQNGSGIQDPGENGRPDVVVYLDLNRNGQRDSFEPQTTTNASGEYLLDQVYPDLDDAVIVRIDAPSGFGVTAPRNLHLGLDITLPAGAGARSVAVGDLNSDNEPDLVVVNGDGSLLIVLRQSGLYSYQTITPAEGRVPQLVQLADINNDGVLDIVTVNDSNTADVSVFPGRGDGSFGNQTSVSLSGTGRQFVIDDLNADGSLDLAVVLPFEGLIAILHNDGSGGLLLQPALSVSGFPHALVTGDFNEDGNTDLVAADLSLGEVIFFAGTPGGTFASPVSSVADDGIQDIASGDFNEDGHLDLAVISSSTVQLTILTGDGSGEFEIDSQISLVDEFFFGSAHHIIATDIDGDGHVDLAITEGGSALGVVLAGDGDGGFPTSEIVEATINGGVVSKPVASDLNGDGLPELIVTNLSLGAIHLIENQAATVRISAVAGQSYSGISFGVQTSNQSPVIQAPVSEILQEDTAFIFSSASSTAITVSDPDVADSDLELSLTAINGTLTLGTLSGLVFLQGDGTNDAGITVRGSSTSINAALEGLQYTPVLNFSGSGQLTITVSDLGNTGAGGPQTAAATVLLTVAPVNDAPAIQVPGTQTVAEDSSLEFGSGSGNIIQIQDVDATSAEVTLAVTNGTLTLGDSAGLSFTSGDGTADVMMTFTGPLSLINAALDGLQFIPNANYNGQALLTVMVSDLGQTGAGGPQTASESVNINVTAVNDAPVVSVPGPQTIDEDSPLIFGSSNGTAITVSDVDATSGRITLSATRGVLTLSSTTGLTFSNGDGTADTTMTFAGTLTSINSALDGLTFIPDMDFTGIAHLSVDVDDQGNAGAGGILTGGNTVEITVTAVNDAPVLTVPESQAVSEDSTLVFSSSHGNAVTVADPDAATLQLELSVSNGRISLGTLSGLTFSSGDGTSDSSMIFTGAPASINAALNGLTFEPMADFAGISVLDLTLSDLGASGSGGVLSATDSVFITVVAVNDGPSINVPGTQTVNEDQVLAFGTASGNAVSISDVDASIVEVTLVATGGVLTLSGTVGLTFSTGDGTSDAETTFTGSLSSINAALEGLHFLPSLDFTGDAQLSLTVNDLGNTGAGGALTANESVTINVTAINDAPVVSVPGQQSVNEDSSLTFGVSHDNPVTVSDAEAATLQLTLSATHGLITLASSAGLTFSSGDGSSDATMTFTGSSTNINAALDGLTFQPDADFAGTAGLSLILSDLGQSGSGGEQSVSDSIDITVNAINDAPSISAPSSATTTRDITLIFSQVEGQAILINDPDAGADAIELTLTVQHGTMTLATVSGLTFSSGDGVGDASLTFSGTLSQINAALNGLTYQPEAGRVGSDELSLLASDLGHTGAGGPLTASHSIALTINAGNAPPSFPPQTLEFTINEHAQAGTLVHTVLASDPDSAPSDLSFAIIGGNATGAFAIDPVTGALTVASSEALDFETQSGFTLSIQVTDSRPVAPTPLTATQTFTIQLNDLVETFVIGADAFAQGSVTLLRDGDLLRAVDANHEDLVPPAQFDRVADILVTGRPGQNDVLQVQFGSVPLISGGTTISAPALRVLGDLTAQAGILDVTGDLTATGLFAPASGSRFRDAVTAEAGANLDGITIDGAVLIAGPTTISGTVAFNASAILTGPATVSGTLSVPNETLVLTGDVTLDQGLIQANAGTQFGGAPPQIGGGGIGGSGTGGGVVIGFTGGIVTPLAPATLSGEGSIAGGLLRVMSNGVINPSGISRRITLPATSMSPGSVLHADLSTGGTSDSVRSTDLLTPDGAFLQPVLLQPAAADATFIIVQNDGTGMVGSGLFGPAIDSGTGTDLGASQVLITDLTDGRATLFSDSFGSLDDGTFDPVGPVAEAGAIFESSVFFRSNGTGPRSSLSELGTEASTIRGTGQEGNSTFRIGNLLFTLTQTLTPIAGTGDQIIGSLLTQTYVVTNTGASAEEFELARYLDADLLFDGTQSDRGGRLVTQSGVELLYEIDSGSSGPSSSTLVAITAIGGTHPQTGRFAIDSFSGLRQDLRDGLNLDDQIAGDADLDGVIDEGAEYDVTLAFLNLFILNAGESDTYTTHAILATGLPEDVAQAGDTTFAGLPEGSGLDVPILNELDQVVGTQRFVISYFGGDGNDIELRVSSGISGRAWQDLNTNGARDVNEPALAGVTVRLFDQQTGDLLASTTTDQGGIYHFDDLTAGDYFIEFMAPDGQILTLRDATSDDVDSDANRLTGRTSVITLESGQSLSGIDAGFIEAQVSIQGPGVVDEGPLGALTPADFTVTLNGPSMVPVTVLVQAFSGQSGPANSRATLGVDFQQIPSEQSLVTFQPGQTSQRVRLNVTGDNLPEQDERFEVRLLNPTQATLGQGTAVVTIINDDVEAPRVVLNPVASVIEGQAPDVRPLEFSVRLLGGPVDQNITVSYETILPVGPVPVGVATPGVDYVAASGTVIIPAGQTTALIRLQVIGDRAIEPDETLQIRLTSLQAGTTGAVLGNVTQATGTIINDDVAVPTLTIGNAETIEQNAPRRVALQFPVTLNGPSDQDVTITFSTLQLTGTGTATAGVDYVAVSGKTLVIPRGRTSGILEIEVIGDSTIEPDEVVAVEITAVANAILQESVGIGTIINDDFARPKVLLRDASILEGRQGQVTPLHFELIMTGALPQDVIVTVSTAALNQPGSATSGIDFEAVTSRQVRIPAGTTSVFIPVQIFGDELEENDEQFRLLITQAGAAVDIDPTRQQATGTILNDDRSRPMVSIDRETSALELNAPRTSTADFVVRLNAVSNQEVTVAFRTQEADTPGAATADVDFRSVNNGVITFAPGETEKVVQIIINGDDLIEPPETFFLELTGITAGAADLDPFQRFSQAVIFDNDEARPVVSLAADINVLEPDNNGRSVAELAVNLSSTHTENITIHYVTRSGPPPGSATPGIDFTDAASGTLVIPAGARSGVIRIEILGDRLIEGDETFVVELVEVTSANADLAPGGRQAVVTIVDNDFAQPTVSLSGSSVIEGDPGDESELVFLVSLSGPAPTSTVQVELETFRLADDLPGLARSEGAGRDYFATTRTLTFEPGVTTKEFRVRVVPDNTFEATEQVFVRITSATGAAIDLVGASVSGFIINDDPPEPILSINSVRVLEGDAPGEMSLTFEVTLDADPEAGVIPDVTVNYTTIDLSALAGQDYTATSGTLTFTDGIRSRLITVPVLGNLVDDGLRELLVELSSPMGATLHPGAFQGLGTIRDDDSPNVVFEINSVEQREGSSGTTPFNFTVTRIGKSATPVSVDFSTQPGTATAGVDYIARSGTLTFLPGSPATQTISISIIGDQVVDSEFETFFVTLSNPVGATLEPGTRQGTGTILDDDIIVFSDDANAELLRIAGIIQDAIDRLGNDPDNQELIALITLLSREVLQRVGLSSGFVYVTDPVDFLLTDAAGRTTGYTQAAGEVTQVPRSYYSGDRNVELVVIPQATSGVYGLQLSGVGSGEYRAAATLVREDGTAKTLTQAGTLSGDVQLALDFSDIPNVRFDREIVAQLADNLRNNAGVTSTNRQIAVSEEAMQALALAQAGLRDAVTDNSRPISAGDAFGRLFSVFSQAGQSLAGEFTRQFNELLRDLGGEDASEAQTPEETERDEAVDQFWSRLGRTLIGAPGNLLDLSEFFEVLTPESESPNSTPTEAPQNDGKSDGQPSDPASPSSAGPKTTKVERPANRFRAWADSRYARSDADKPSPWQPVSQPKAGKAESARNATSTTNQPGTKDRKDVAQRDERPQPDDSGNSATSGSDDAAE